MSGTQTVIHRDVEAARAGREPRVLARVPSGWALFGAQQFVRGYLLLLPDPVVPQLNSLQDAARAQFLADMTRLGDALLATTGAVRINYAIFGNVEPALHAHVFPRHADEPAHRAKAHPWAHDWEAAERFEAARAAELIERIRRALRAD